MINNEKNFINSIKYIGESKRITILAGEIVFDLRSGKEVKLSDIKDGSVIRTYTKTLYSYVDLGFMNAKNSDLPIKVRLNKKKRFNRINKIKLGRSIEERDKLKINLYGKVKNSI
ncbi:hypothetical protein [Clostridium gasigenes]|uniref:hypothetical protein n=1 Tax=Clostridium gasigenes TaxID=94869 RepID=UPI001C0DAED3|nr:hypothetical protein [Clostridium gasigenes]